METYTSRFWLRRGVSGLVGTLTYAVKSSGGTHQAATTTGIAADSDDSGLYFIDVTVDTSWGSNAWIEWLDGSDKFTEAIFPSHNLGQLNGDAVDLRNNDQTVGSVEQDSTQPVKFQMSAAGLTLSTTQIAKPGGAFANTAGTFTNLGNGWYEYTPTAGETDTLGVAGLHIVASTGETVPVRFGVSGASGANISVAPLETQVISPYFTSFGPITKHLSIPQNAAGTFSFAVVDEDGNAIDLSGKSLKFNVHDSHGTIIFSRTSAAGQITITGASSNVANVAVAATNTTTAGSYAYKLWSLDDDTLYATGDFKIPLAPQ